MLTSMSVATDATYRRRTKINAEHHHDHLLIMDILTSSDFRQQEYSWSLTQVLLGASMGMLKYRYISLTDSSGMQSNLYMTMLLVEFGGNRSCPAGNN